MKKNKIISSVPLLIILFLFGCDKSEKAKKPISFATTPKAEVASELTVNDGFTGTAAHSALATWSAVKDAESYELAIGSAPGLNDIKDWTNVGNSLSASLSISATLVDGQKYFTGIRSINATGVFGKAIYGDGWINISQYKATNSGPDFNGYIYTMDSDHVGNQYVAGDFSAYNPVKINQAVAIAPSGNISSTINFSFGTNNGTVKILPLSNGKYIAYGGIGTYQGSNVKAIIRLNADGTLDTSFNLDTNLGPVSSSTISDIQIDSSDNVYLLLFNSGRTKLFKLTSNGSINSTFSGNTTASEYSQVSSFGLYSNTDIYVKIASAFYHLDSDGNMDQNFEIVTSNTKIKLLADNTILLYGNSRIEAFNSDGSLNTFLQNNLRAASNTMAEPTEFLELPDSKLVIIFKQIPEYSTFITKTNADGTKDTTFLNEKSVIGLINKLRLFADQSILVSGYPSSYDNKIISNGIFKLNTDGSLNENFLANKPGFGDGWPSEIFIKPDNTIIASGSITSFGGTTTYSIAKTLNNQVIPFIHPPSFNGYISKIKVVGDEIWVLGKFTRVNGLKRNGIAKIKTDGSLDLNSFNGEGFNSESLQDIIVQKDKKVIIAGKFTSYNNFPVGNIIRLLPDGSRDSSFNVGSGFDNEVMTIDTQSDGKIVVAGSFTSYKGVAVDKLARLKPSGALDTTFGTGSGFDQSIEKIKVNGDKIIVATTTTLYNSHVFDTLIQLNNDGSVDDNFYNDSLSGFISDLMIEQNGQILVAGSLYNSFSSNVPLLRLNPNGSLDLGFNIKDNIISGSLYSVTKLANGKIYIGGAFANPTTHSRNFMELSW